VVKEKRLRMPDDEEIDLHIMEVDVLEGRYSRSELVNGNPALSTLHPLHHSKLGRQSQFVSV
jgi:hypothetical protein